MKHIEDQNIRFMNQTELVQKLKTLVHEERKITAEILNHLCEVDSQKIFARMGYPSLFEFCTKELGYSEGAAQRRISAMRLIKELPQVEEKIISGALSLSVVSQAQTFFKKKKQLKRPMAAAQKINLLSSLENVSTRECEKVLLQLEPELVTKDKERYIGPETLEIKITVDKEFIENLETLKNQFSHKMPYATTKDILSLALKSLVAANEIAKPKVRTVPSEGAKSSVRMVPSEGAKLKVSVMSHQLPPAPAVNKAQEATAKPREAAANKQKSRYISIHSKRALWHANGGKCQYADPLTGRRCESRRFLEIDHVTPKAMGGSNNIENLQLLCDTHNRLKSSN